MTSSLASRNEIDSETGIAQDIITAMTRTKFGRHWLTERSVKWFAKYYLGINLYPHQVDWINHLLKHRRAGVLAPVSHGKTVALSEVLALYLVVQNRNIRILYLSATDDLAKKNLSVIAHHLKYNERLIEDYGAFYHRDKTWEARKLTVVRDRILKDCTVESIGATGEKTGGRYDVIILDDAVTEKNSNTAAQRLKLHNIILGTIIQRLDRPGWFWFIGTRKDYADLYSEFLALKGIWNVMINKAIIRYPEKYELVELPEPIEHEDGTTETHRLIIEGDPGEVLDPINRPMEYLLLEKMSQGSRLFEREFQNNITDNENALFKLEWLEQCRDEKFSYASLDYNMTGGKVIQTGSFPDASHDINNYIAKICGTDPAIVTDETEAETSDSSYFVNFTLGVHKNGNVDILHIFKHRGMTPNQKVEFTKQHDLAVEPDYHMYEKNAFGSMDIWKIRDETNVPIVPHHTGKNKNSSFEGVPYVSVRFENKKIKLPYKTTRDKHITNDMISELNRFPGGDHDDMVMALWIAMAGVKRFMRLQEKKAKKAKRVA